MKKVRNNRQESAITLIALVITIVVLIILAAVAINLSLGNNGIFNRAKSAKEQYANSQEYEQEKTDGMESDINSYIKGNRDITDEEIETRIKNVLDNYYQKLKSYNSENVSFTDGGRYTAPCDGYYCFGTNVSNQESYINARVDLYNASGLQIGTYGGGGAKYNMKGGDIYMRKGEYIVFLKQSNVSVYFSKFFYAVGCSPTTTE